MTQKIQLSKRLDDGSILVVSGDNVEEFVTNATALVGGEGAADLVGLFFELIPASAGSNPNPGPQPATAEDPIAAAKAVLAASGLKTEEIRPTPDASAGPSCKHGPREFRSGASKGKFNPDGTPKQWKMWACPSRDRQDECDPTWVR